MDNPLNPNIHTIVKAQIVFLLSTLTEENFERNQSEIRSVSTLYFWPSGRVGKMLIVCLLVAALFARIGIWLVCRVLGGCVSLAV